MMTSSDDPAQPVPGVEPRPGSADENARAARAARGSPFLAPAQAAFYLGLSVRTLQLYRSKGGGPRFRRHSRHVRYHIDDLDTWSRASGDGPTGRG